MRQTSTNCNNITANMFLVYLFHDCTDLNRLKEHLTHRNSGITIVPTPLCINKYWVRGKRTQWSCTTRSNPQLHLRNRGLLVFHCFNSTVRSLIIGPTVNLVLVWCACLLSLLMLHVTILITVRWVSVSLLGLRLYVLG